MQLPDPLPMQGPDTETVIAVILHMSRGNEHSILNYASNFSVVRVAKRLHSVVIAET